MLVTLGGDTPRASTDVSGNRSPSAAAKRSAPRDSGSPVVATSSRRRDAGRVGRVAGLRERRTDLEVVGITNNLSASGRFRSRTNSRLTLRVERDTLYGQSKPW